MSMMDLNAARAAVDDLTLEGETLEKRLKEYYKKYPRIVRVMPPLPVAGYIETTFEDGSTSEHSVRTEKKIRSIEFIPERDSCPWDYDNPDEDGVFGD